MSVFTREDFNREISPFRRFVQGMIRRVAVIASDSAMWRILGHNGGSGGDETPDLPIYPGIGFYSRPDPSGKPEALMVALGGAKAIAIAATRDEATRRAIANLELGETAIFTPKAIVVIKADGTVEIRSKAGTARALPTLAAVTQINTALTNAITTVGGATVAGATLTALQTALLALDPDWPASTDVLKAE